MSLTIGSRKSSGGGGGGSTPNFVTKTSNYNISITDDIIFVDTTGGAFTLTLPAPSSVSTTTTTKIYRIVDIGGVLNTNNLTLAPNSSEKIEGLAASKLLQTNWGYWQVTTNHTDWFVG